MLFYRKKLWYIYDEYMFLCTYILYILPILEIGAQYDRVCNLKGLKRHYSFHLDFKPTLSWWWQVDWKNVQFLEGLMTSFCIIININWETMEDSMWMSDRWKKLYQFRVYLLDKMRFWSNGAFFWLLGFRHNRAVWIMAPVADQENVIFWN